MLAQCAPMFVAREDRQFGVKAMRQARHVGKGQTFNFT